MYARSRALSFFFFIRLSSAARPTSFLRCAAMRRAAGSLVSFAVPAFCVHTSSQGIHETDDLCWLPTLGPLDRLAGLFLLQQFLQRIFVVVLKFFGLEVAGLGFDDVRRQLQHVLRNFLILDILEILVLFADLVRISQRDAKQSFAARLECDEMLARSENDSPESHHAFLADRLANDRECLLADFTIGNEVVGAVEIELVDFFLGHELVDLDRTLALDRNGLKLFGLDFDVLAFADFIALD